jgi:Flp pilus assembly protein TadG
MASRTSDRPHKEPGQVLVEFAVVLLAFVPLMFGILDLGRAVFAYSTIANAARQGARVAVVNQLDVSASTACNLDMPIENIGDPHWQIKPCAAKAAVALNIDESAVSVSYSPPPGANYACSPKLHVGCIASVTVTYAWNPVTPIVSSIVGSIPMNSTSQIPIEAVFP